MTEAQSRSVIAVLRRHLVGLNSWREQSVNRRIFAALVLVAALTAFVKLASAAKEIFVAYHFGVGDALDAFLIAFLLPSFAVNVIAGSFTAAFVPTFIAVREREGGESAQRLFVNVLVRGLLLLLAAAALLAFASPLFLPVIGSGFDSNKLALTHSLFLMLLPLIVISGLATIASALLNAGERFAAAAIVPAVTPITTVVSIVVLAPKFGIFSLVVGVLAGVALEAGILMWVIGWSVLRPLRPAESSHLKDVRKQYLPMVAGALLFSSTEIVNQSMAATLGTGSVAALGYANRIVAFFLSVGAMAIGTAVLPHFSRLAAVADWVTLRHTLLTYARLILFVTVPLVVLVIFFSNTIVALLFERGAFHPEATAVVSQALAFYMLQVPFYLIGTLLVRLISAMKANHILMQGAIISIALNVSLNYVFMQRMGVAGIALSTSIVYAVSAGYLAFRLARLKGRLLVGE